MTGITYDVWRLCGIVFILLLPYVVWKRRLWFPGLAAMGLGVFGSVKFWPAMGGSLRVWDLLIKELSLLSIYWVSLFPAAILGGCNLHNLGLIAILPCAVRFIILSHAGTMRSGKPPEKIVTTWLPGHALPKSR